MTLEKLKYSNHSALLLDLVGYDASIYAWPDVPSVALLLNGYTVVNVYEGCNAINVSILFVAFLFAYKGTIKKTFIYSIIGLIAIYVFNLFRVAGLYLVANYFPDHCNIQIMSID